MSLYLIHYGVKGMKWGVRRSKAELKANREKAIREYQDSVIKVRNSDLKNGLPTIWSPNAVVDKIDDYGKTLQRAEYGKDAINKLLFDINDHGNRKKHPTGAHKHIMDFTKKKPHSKPLPLTMKELAYNSDIIQRGKNYFDDVYLKKSNNEKEVKPWQIMRIKVT